MARLFDDGSSEYLEHSASSISEPFAVSAWVRTDDATPSVQVVWCAGDTDAKNDHMIFLYSVTSVVWAHSRESGSTGYAETSTNWSVNTWHHVFGAWTAANYREISLDAGGLGTGTVPKTVANLDNTTIGTRHHDSAYDGYFSGRIAEVAVWDLSVWPGATAANKLTAMKTAALQGLADGYSPLFWPLGLVNYWPLGGMQDASDGDHDIVGTYDMTPANTPSTADHPAIVYPAECFISKVASVAGGVAPHWDYYFRRHAV